MIFLLFLCLLYIKVYNFNSTPKDVIDDLINNNDFNSRKIQACLKKRVLQKCQNLFNFTYENKCLQEQVYYCLQKTEPLKFHNQRLKDGKNICLNGHDKSKLSLKQQLIEFGKGPCSPLIIAPGLMATKISIKINCQELMDYEKHTFQFCGWNACEKSIYEIWKEVPLPEYELWIPSITSPMSLFAFSKTASLCFANLIKPHVNMDKPVEEMVIQKKGVQVEIFGFSDNRKKDSNCGAAAVSNLLPLPIQLSQTYGFSKLIKTLESYGYQSGLNFQVIPYNFYLSYRKNEFSKTFLKNLKRLKKLTGKKSTLLAHSMGNLNVLYNLQKMSQDLKNELVFNYVAIGPVYLGAYEATKTIATSITDFQTLRGYLGFHFEGSVKVCENQLSLYDIVQKNPFLLYKDEPWFQQIIQRINYEENYPQLKDKGISFWPEFQEKCFKDNKCNFATNCSIGLKNIENQTIITIGKEKYTLQTIDQFFEKYELIPRVQAMYDKLYSEELVRSNPGVPVLVVYTRIIDTIGPFELATDFEERIQNRSFPNVIKQEKVRGDGTVPVFSSIILPLKWALEFEEDPNGKYPVKFIEYCSLYNTDAPIYDTLEPFGPKRITKNDFFGLECDCMLHSSSPMEKHCDYSACNHAAMVNNVQIIDFVTRVLNANQKTSQEDLDRISLFDEQELMESIINCDHIIGSIFDEPFETQEI